MKPTIRLGRIAGVEIGANWSWLLVVALIVWSLAGGVFPATNPGLGDARYVAMALAATVLFFASLLAHELGHAVQARREGMAIAGITLWVFGGVAQFSGRFPSAGAELRIAGAGPLVSLALGVLFVLLALVAPLGAEVDAVVFWLGQINLTLLAFNLLPALPLDGGRILRALLWGRRGDFRAATRTAAALGRAFGQVLIGGGLALVIFVGAFGGVWLAFIGWFLLGAADAEARAAELGPDTVAGRLTVADVLVRDPVSVPPELTLDRFVDEVFLTHRHTAYPVVDGGLPVGLITFRDALAVPRETWAQTRVSDRMAATGRVPAFDTEARLVDVLPVLAEDRRHRGLVHEDGRFAGLVSITDVARVLEAERGA